MHQRGSQKDKLHMILKVVSGKDCFRTISMVSILKIQTLLFLLVRKNKEQVPNKTPQHLFNDLSCYFFQASEWITTILFSK